VERAPLARLEYAEIVDLNSLQPVQRLDQDTIIALAIHFGKTRLIDNLVLYCHDGQAHFS
jgi:pantoate--beta-alanine ligase